VLDDALDAVDAVVGVVGEAVDVVDVVDDFPFAKKNSRKNFSAKNSLKCLWCWPDQVKGEWFKQFSKFYCQKVCLKYNRLDKVKLYNIQTYRELLTLL
jgi:hypothetical protein